MTAGLLAAPPARADGLGEIELGLFGGAHLFADDTELGRWDDDKADNRIQHSFAGGLRFALYFHRYIGLELEAVAMPTKTQGKAPDTMKETDLFALGYRGHAMIHFWHGRVRPFLVLGYGAVSTPVSSNEKHLSRDTDETAHGGLGLKVDLTRHIGLRLDGRVLLPPRIGDSSVTVDGEVFLGGYARLNRGSAGPGDRDKDGVTDEKDKCPDEAGDPAYAGCPPDRDGDGLADNADRCPTEPGPRSNRGCPLPKDRDGDGLVDAEDKCPQEAGPRENQGCPDRDSDGDAVVDRLDKCPDVKGDPDNAGCPPKDTDGDGLIDKKDKCVTEPETKNSYQDDDGCPDELPVEVKRFTGVIKGINFKTNSAVILKNSFVVLDQAAKVLTDFDSIRLEIQGHTDDVGKRPKNMKLSQDRAESVMRYLMGRGVESSRLRAVGYGPDRPIAAGKSGKARAQNRRVEFQTITD